jgi:hypothetical protein
MKSLVCSSLVVLVVAGCGPMQTPLPSRPDAEQQKGIDESWDNALRPLDRFDHQGLLDLLMVSKAYELGVDKLSFRSEKKVALGTVVMEVHYDRLKPAEDRFEMQLLDGAGKVLRQERYDRDVIEKTYKELFVECEQLRRKKDRGQATPEELKKLTGYEARFKTIEEVFPKDKDKGK